VGVEETDIREGGVDGHVCAGAGGQAAHWALLVPELRRRGHQVIAVEIAGNDPALGLPEYAQIIDRAIGGQPGVVLVAHSLAGFTAPMIRQPVAMIVLLNAMIPEPGETPGEWWDTTGSGAARRAADEAAGRSGEFDIETHFLHDLRPRPGPCWQPPDRHASQPTPLSGSRARSSAGRTSRSRC